MKYKVYEVYMDGEMIMKGTAKELADKLRCTPKHVQSSSYFYGYSKLFGMYDVKRTDVSVENMPTPKGLKKKQVVDKEKEKLDSMAWYLKTSGIYYYGQEDPSPAIEALKQMGIDCNYRTKTEYPKKKGTRGRKPHPVTHYYLEVINAT